MVAAQSAPAPPEGSTSVSPSYSAAGGADVRDAAPPCLSRDPAAVQNGPTLASTEAAARARAARIAKRQKEIDADTTELMQLVQNLRAATAAQDSGAVLSAAAVKDAQEIARVAKQLQAALKAQR